jgi:iron complex transport system permease protein
MSNLVKFLLFLIFLLVSIILSLGFGSVPIPAQEIVAQVRLFLSSGQLADNNLSTIIFAIRLPRTLFAVVCGMGLSLVGLIMQTITRNYLADPYILGVSSGASTGAVCAIILGWFGFLGTYNVSLGAFLVAAVATAMVLLLLGHSSSPIKLVLIGMGISAVFAAITMLIIYSAKHEAQVRSAMFWLLGSLSGIQWSDLPAAVIMTVILILFVWFLRHDFDLVLLGENEARQMGLAVKQMQFLVVIMASLAVAVFVAKAGVIGFIGLIIPHLARVLVGAKHGVLVIFSSLIGALVLLWSDVLSRSLFSPEEVPIGVLTSILGAPLFIWIICKRYGGE